MKDYVIYFKTKTNRNHVQTTKSESLEAAQEKAERIKKVQNYKSVHKVFEMRTDI